METKTNVIPEPFTRDEVAPSMDSAKFDLISQISTARKEALEALEMKIMANLKVCLREKYDEHDGFATFRFKKDGKFSEAYNYLRANGHKPAEIKDVLIAHSTGANAVFMKVSTGQAESNLFKATVKFEQEIREEEEKKIRLQHEKLLSIKNKVREAVIDTLLHTSENDFNFVHKLRTLLLCRRECNTEWHVCGRVAQCLAATDMQDRDQTWRQVLQSFSHDGTLVVFAEKNASILDCPPHVSTKELAIKLGNNEAVRNRKVTLMFNKFMNHLRSCKHSIRTHLHSKILNANEIEENVLYMKFLNTFYIPHRQDCTKKEEEKRIKEAFDSAISELRLRKQIWRLCKEEKAIIVHREEPNMTQASKPPVTMETKHIQENKASSSPLYASDQNDNDYEISDESESLQESPSPQPKKTVDTVSPSIHSTVSSTKARLQVI